MASFSISSAKLSGNPGASGWAQVHEFKPDDKEKLSLRGHLFAVFATSGEEATSSDDFQSGGGIDNVTQGRELIARLHEEYFGNTTATAYNALKEAVEKVIKEFKESWGNVEIAAAVFLEDIVYSAVGGGAQAVLFRDKALVKILVSEKEGVVSASGYPKQGDIFLLGTSLLFKEIKEEVIRSALESGNADEAAEALAPIVHAGKDLGSAGAVIIKFEKKGVFPEKTKGDKITAVEVSKEKKEEKTQPEFARGLRTKLANLLDRAIKTLPERRIYVKEEMGEVASRSNRKVAIAVGGILIALLAISITFGVRQKRVKEGRLRYEERLTQARYEFEEAQTLVSLNTQRSRELFISAKNTVTTLEEEGVKDPLLEELKNQIEQKTSEILGEYNQEPVIFVDVSLLSDGFSGEDLAATDERVFVLDPDGEKIISVLVDTKKAEVIAGPGLVKGANFLAAFSDKVFTTTPSGITEISGSSASEIISEGWQGEIFIYSFAGNLYVLEKGTSGLWRFPVFEGGYGAKQSWFGQGVTPDLSNVISWTIDGSIWLLTNDARILKFTRGSPETFSIKGVSPPLDNPVAIYSNENLDFIYVLDPGEGRIVVLEKNGEYKAQYFDEAIRQALDLAVFEEEGKLIFLTGPQLLSIELKHLEE
ncbi:hypothetical protein IID21_03430 [Patescibacteria group bacterium]|nr:hypothetical protein [Patescibacteria group bacterium]